MSRFDLRKCNRSVMRSTETLKSQHWSVLGKEPDYRFTLANERTFLAWVRTALAILAGGLLLDQFAAELKHREVVLAAALFLVTVAAVVSVVAYLRWCRFQIAMRNGGNLEHGLLIPLLALSLCAVAATLLTLLVT